MKNSGKIRKWATPVTIGAFVLSAVTGIMLLFKVQLGMIKPVHEWLSLLLVAGTVFHVIANWKIFVKYFSNPLAKVIIGIFLVITCASLIPIGETQGGGPPPARVSGILAHTPLSSVAMIAGHDPEEAVTMLSEKGVKLEGKEQSIGAIAKMNGKEPVYILDIIF